MIKANIVIRVEDGNNTYNVGDKVKCLMKPIAKHGKDYEYIGKIVDVQETFMTVDTGLDFVVLCYTEILMIKPLLN